MTDPELIRACSSCAARILFARNLDTGRVMPIDADPSPRGQLTLLVVNGQHYYRHERNAAVQPRYISHFATCPNAAQHRHPEDPRATDNPTRRRPR